MTGSPELTIMSNTKPGPSRTVDIKPKIPTENIIDLSGLSKLFFRLSISMANERPTLNLTCANFRLQPIPNLQHHNDIRNTGHLLPHVVHRPLLWKL